MSALFEGRAFAAILFDMDGTLINSIASANRVWARWAESRGLDPLAVRATMHGVRAVETVGRWRPDLDAAAEADAITLAEIDDVAGVVPIGGAAAFLESLPEGRWAIVTSAPRDLALKRLAEAGLSAPAVFVTAEDVTRGKPAPDGYRAAAAALGVAPEACLVCEDAPAGIAAGEAAGGAVLVIGETHDEPIETPHPVVRDYRGLGVRVDADGGMVIVAEEGA